MSFKNVTQNKEGRDKVKIGVDIVADAIKVTMGFGGRNVLIGNGYGPVHISKDGATVAKGITLVEPIQNMGATLIKEVAFKTLADAGDGTTCSTVLAQAIITAGLKAIDEGANPVDLKKGIEKATDAVVKRLKELSKDVDSQETLIQIATISANNDPEIGKLIADAFTQVGKEGEINVTDSKTHETYVEIVNGMKIDRGLMHPIYINTKRRTCEFEHPIILVTDKKLSTYKELLPFLEKAVNQPKPILLIVDRIEGEALQLIYGNMKEAKINLCVVLAPEYGDDRQRALEDICVLTGATFISDAAGRTIEKATLKDCGSAEKVIVDAHSTLFVNGAGDGLSVTERCDEIRTEIEGANEVQAAKLKSRLAKMIGKIASLKVGAITQTEATEKKDRIDDALCATRAANEEGYLSGGGTAFMKSLDFFTTLGITGDELTGALIVRSSIIEPFDQILRNAGKSKEQIDSIAKEIIEGDYGIGFNVKSDKIENLFDAGVIDPTKVCRCALENASSIAAIFLTTECVVSDPKPKEY